MFDDPNLNNPDELAQAARQLTQQGLDAQAVAVYERILYLAPGHCEALLAVAEAALKRGDALTALSRLSQARTSGMDEGTLQVREGVAFYLQGNFEEAEQKLDAALKHSPEHVVARLHYGLVREKLGDARGALLAYFRAIITAHKNGLWLNQEQTPEWLLSRVVHAVRFVQQGQRRFYANVLQPLYERYGRDSLHRVERCIATYLGDLPKKLTHPGQRPTFLCFPDIPATPFIDRQYVPWLELLEQNTVKIREEMLAAFAGGAKLDPFLQYSSEEEVRHLLKNDRATPAWDAYFLYRDGLRLDENCQRCPITSEVVDSLPIPRIPSHSPEICFSVLTPGTHILPHTGMTNIRIVTHLPLVVPENCALEVVGQKHQWQEGRAMAFDDTFEHQAWNSSVDTRVVLLMDAWNPHLTEVEREAMTEFVVAIGEFNRDAWCT